MDSDQLQPLLEPLMCRLVPLLDHRLLGIREMAAAAVGSAAVAASDKFDPLSRRYGAATRGHGRARGRTGLGAAWEVSGSAWDMSR